MSATLRKKLFLLCMISGIAISGCSGNKNMDAYGSVLSALKESQSYAYLKMGDGNLPVLLVTDGTYTYEEGVEASFMGEAYYAFDAKVYHLGKIISSGTAGTAYPIRYDREGIYVAGLHSVEKYSMDYEKKQLVLDAYAEETFDENGDAVYTCYHQGKSRRTEDASFLNKMAGKYENADVVSFVKGQG